MGSSDCEYFRSALLLYLQKIQYLSQMPQPEALDLAIDVMAYFSNICSGSSEYWEQEKAGEREADRPADYLFCTLIRRRLRVVPTRDFDALLVSLYNAKKELATFRLEKGYFDRTIAALHRWQGIEDGESPPTSELPELSD